MTFEESVRQGLRIEGSETSIEGVRHRRRYQWAANRINELKILWPRVLDHGCGSGHGCKIMGMVLTGASVQGYDPDVSATEYARAHWWESCSSDRELLMLQHTDVVVTHGVLEHIQGTYPTDKIQEFFDAGAHAVVGFVPYREKPGLNPHHFWFGLDPATMLAPWKNVEVWYEPLVSSRGDDHVDHYYSKEKQESFFQTGRQGDAINFLFVIRRDQ